MVILFTLHRFNYDTIRYHSTRISNFRCCMQQCMQRPLLHACSVHCPVTLTMPSIGIVACAPDWLARHDAAWLSCYSVH